MRDNYLDLGGTLRSRSPEETIKFLEPLLPKMGITRVANITGLDVIDVPVAVSVRPNSKHLSTSQGKGVTWELAYISAVMESIEGYHAENLKAPQLRGSYRELVNDYPVIDPTLFNKSFFQHANLQDLKLDWIEAFEIPSKKPVFLPYIIACLDSSELHPEYSFLSSSSNGLAAGNTLEEAICHGLYELIERDSAYKWGNLSETEQSMTQIIPSTVDSSVNRNLLEKLAAKNIYVKMWDATSIMGVPVFRCVIQEPNPLRCLGSFGGAGAHLSKDIALSRAITEAIQSRLTLISGSRDDMFFDQYMIQRKPLVDELNSYEGKRDYRECQAPMFAKTFAEHIDDLVQRLHQHHFKNIYVIDHTKPEMNIPVAHVFVPGLQFSGNRI